MNSTPQQQSDVLNGIATELDAIQAIDSNADGFAIRLQGMQEQGVKTIIQARESGCFDQQPWAERLNTIIHRHLEQAPKEWDAQSSSDFHIHVWWEITGHCFANGTKTGDSEVNWSEVKGDPLFPTPFDSRQISLRGLQHGQTVWGRAAAAQSRRRAAFICRKLAEIICSQVTDESETKTGAELSVNQRGNHSGETAAHQVAHQNGIRGALIPKNDIAQKKIRSFDAQCETILRRWVKAMTRSGKWIERLTFITDELAVLQKESPNTWNAKWKPRRFNDKFKANPDSWKHGVKKWGPDP
jgi:hypothetical protein